MTCKDCVSYDMCKYRHFQEAQRIRANQTILISIDHNKPCKFFKNKADFVEVKHGEWIVEEELKTPLSHAYIRKEKTYHCPYCNKQYRQKMNFCGNCGADMRKEGADNEQRD